MYCHKHRNLPFNVNRVLKFPPLFDFRCMSLIPRSVAAESSHVPVRSFNPFSIFFLSCRFTSNLSESNQTMVDSSTSLPEQTKHLLHLTMTKTTSRIIPLRHLILAEISQGLVKVVEIALELKINCGQFLVIFVTRCKYRSV